MTLALRRASDKYTHIESVLRERMFELQSLRADLKATRSERDAASSQIVQLRAQAQEYLRSRREIEHEVRLANEQRTISDLALNDYAALVRALEKSNGTTDLTWPEEGLAQGRLGLSRLFREHSSEVELLHAQIAELQAQSDANRQLLDFETETTATLKAELADTHLLLEQIRSDDAGAAKVVARYMSGSAFSIFSVLNALIYRQFSQETTNALQESLEVLRQRHAATVESLEVRLVTMSEASEAEYAQNRELHRLQAQCQMDLAFERDARRREVALRLACIEHNSSLRESIQRLVHKNRAGLDKLPSCNCDSTGKVEGLLDDIELLIQVETSSQDPRIDRAMSSLVEALRQQLRDASTEDVSLSVARPGTEPESHTPAFVEERSTTEEPPLTTLMLSEAKPVVAESVCHVSYQSRSSEGLENADIAQNQECPNDSTDSSGEEHVPPIEEVNEASALLYLLQATGDRYSELSRGFFACHIELQKLLSGLSDSVSATSHTSVTPLRLVLERLDDYNEDARVELEIRISDEERISRGFEAMLLMSGTGDASIHLTREIENFSSPEFPGYIEIRELFGKKLTDLQYDIAILQRCIYNLPGAGVDGGSGNGNGKLRDTQHP